MPGSTIKLLEDFARFCAVKNKVISKNIANVGTQGYQSEDVKFKDVLDDNMSSLLKTTEPQHIGFSGESSNTYEITRDKNKNNISGANNVDIDKEMAELAENTLNYKFASKKIGDYFKNIQMVIKGGL